MHRIAYACLAFALAAASASAADVFVTRDAQGNPVYTDRPESLPAAKVNVATSQTEEVEAAARHEQAMKQYQEQDKAAAAATKQRVETKQAAQLNAADQAKRCQEARQQYQNLMNARRIYEPGDAPDQRRYLDSGEIDAARANAKQVMDQFCAGQ